MVLVWDSTHIAATDSPNMDKRSLTVIILGALAVGIAIAAAYLVFTWYGRLLTILGAVIMMLYAPSDGTMATTLVQVNWCIGGAWNRWRLKYAPNPANTPRSTPDHAGQHLRVGAIRSRRR